MLADDPIFGRFSFGGEWREAAAGIEVLPRDGLRRRFHARLGGRKLSVVVERGRFPASSPLLVKEDLSALAFAVENEEPAARRAKLRLSGDPGDYTVRGDGESIAGLSLKEGEEAALELPLAGDQRPKSFTVTRGTVGSRR